jgi:trimeric autotransporter adhesin
MTYEKAVFGQAGSGKASGSTFFERKQMTKSFKRVALVAAAALTLGGLTGVAANAAGGYLGSLSATPTITTGTTFIDSALELYCTQSLEGAAAGASSCTGQVGGQVLLVWQPVTADTATAVTVTVSGATITGAGSPSGAVHAPTFGNGVDFTQGVKYTAGGTGASNQLELALTASAAGASTVTVSSVATATGATTTVTSGTINWVAASTITPNAGYSTVLAHTGPNAADITTASSSIRADKAAVTPSTSNLAAEIKVIVRDSNNNAMNAPTVSASLSGPGVIGMATTYSGVATGTYGSGLSLAATSSGVVYVGVWPSGTAGTGTVTITSGGVTLGTATVVFTGTPVSVKLTQKLFVAKASTQLGANPNADFGTTNDGSSVAKTAAFLAEVMDSAGNDVADITTSNIKVLVQTGTAIASGSCVEASSPSYAGNFECSVTGGYGASGTTSNVVFEVQNMTTDTAGTYSVVSTPITFALGGSLASLSISTDSTSYTPLAPMSLVVNGKDSANNAPYDQDAAAFYSGTSVTSSVALGGVALPTGANQQGGTTANATVPLINGKWSLAGLYAPSVSGDFTLTGTDALLDGAITTPTATVSGGDAGLALEAATAAQDAANSAAEAADNATQAANDALAAVNSLAVQVASLVAGLKSQLTSLANLVTKISKKVGVK